MAASVVRVRLLGPVRVEVGSREIRVARRCGRCLLPILLLEPGRAVGVDRLTELIWADDPAAASRAALHTYVSRLRGALAGTGMSLDRCSDGYLLTIDPEAVDAHRFTRMVDRARALDDSG